MFASKSKRQLDIIKQVCSRSQAGIFKRIDENRELLELLQQEAPDVLQRFPWIESWLDSQDTFLGNLAEAAEMDPPKRVDAYPRPWPGNSTKRR